MLVIACTPRVPATIVITEPARTKPDEPEPAEPKPERPRKPGSDFSPPTIIRAEQIGDNLLRLHFSEPLAPLGGFDPNDFRISMLNVYANRRAGYSYAYYADFGYQMYGQAMRFTSVREGESKLDLYFTPAVPQVYCRQFEYANNYAPPGVHVDNGLFLHYAAGSVPVRDEAGNPLANFGADWVERGRSDPPQHRQELVGNQVQTAGQGLPRIQCGPQLPPGPR